MRSGCRPRCRSCGAPSWRNIVVSHIEHAESLAALRASLVTDGAVVLVLEPASVAAHEPVADYGFREIEAMLDIAELLHVSHDPPKLPKKRTRILSRSGNLRS